MTTALLLALTLAAPRCTPEGLYRAEAGFFTRFDGAGHWATSSTADGPPVIEGPVFREGDRLRFKLAHDGETNHPWFASFSEDCQAFVLKHETGLSPDIHFRRVTAENLRKR